MPVVTMPDGTNVSFPDDMPPSQIRNMIALKFPDAAKAAAQGTDTSPTFGGETARAFKSGWEHLHPAETPLPPDQSTGFWSGMLHLPGTGGLASRVNAPLEMALSPVTGLLHGPVARGLAGLESYAGEAGLTGLRALGVDTKPVTPDREQMIRQAQADIDKAMLAAGPVRAGSVGAAVPWGGIGQAVESNIATAQAQEAAAAAAKATAKAVTKAANTPAQQAQQAQQELQQAGTPVDIPWALTYENPALRAGAVALSKTPVVGTPLDEAVRAVPAQMGAGLETMAGKFSPEIPEAIVGSGIERSLTGAAEQEAAGRQAAAAAADEAAQQQFEQTQAAREQAVTDRQNQADAAARRAFGHVHPIEAAEDTVRAVQESHASNQASNQRAWEAVNNVNASVGKDSFHDLHGTISNDITDAGVTLDPERTSNAWSMMQEMRRLSAKPGEAPPHVPPRLMDALEREYGKGQVPPKVLEDLGFPGGTPAQDPNFRLMGRHAPAPDATTVPVQGLDELRKRIGDMAYGATNPTDRRASNAIKSAFNNWLGDALENHLTPGSDATARATIENAITSHREFSNRFGYNLRNLRGENRTAAGMLNQMATGDIGPETVARNLIGAKPGTRGVSAPLHDAIMGAVDNPAQVRASIRGAYWHDMTQGHTPKMIGSNVAQLVGAPGERATRMGRALFEPQEHDLMRGYADLAAQTPENLKAIRAEKPPKPTKVEPGVREQLAGRIVGKIGGGEPVLARFNNALRNNINEAARIWSQMSPANRNETRGTWLRELGGGGEQFSPAKFIKNWESYSKRAKAIMLPDPAHRKQVQNFYTLAKQYGENLSRFGNISGTAPMSAWHKLMVGTVKTAAAVGTGAVSLFHPILMAGAALGGRGIASLLARPESAAQFTRWAGMVQAYNSAPSTTKLIALQNATRLLSQAAEGKK